MNSMSFNIMLKCPMKEAKNTPRSPKLLKPSAKDVILHLFLCQRYIYRKVGLICLRILYVCKRKTVMDGKYR
jgi:hypothetical protein